MWYSEIEVGIDRSLKIMQKTKTSQGGGEEGEGEKIVFPGLPWGTQNDM